ncbi:hypothetical protein pb186bvf_003593 [Paramecium bursaria]
MDKKKPPPVPKFKTQEIEQEKMNSEVENFFAEIQTENVVQPAAPEQEVKKVKDLSHINDKLSSLMKKSTKVNLTTIVNKPQEYDPSKPNDYEELKKLKQQEQQIEQEKPQQMEIEPELDQGASVALKLMENLGYKFGTGLGKYGQGIVAPLIAKKTTSMHGVVEQSQVDFTDLLPQNIVIRRSFEQYKQQIFEYEQKTIKNYSVVLNVVTAAQVDQYLEDEVKEEMKKKVISILDLNQTKIYKLKYSCNLKSSDFRISRDEQTMQAFMNVDQRVFGDRIISCRFYNDQDFLNKYYDADL